MRHFALAVLSVLLLLSPVACRPQSKQTGLAITDYGRALRDSGMHDVRFEKNTRLPGQTGAVAASDIYVAGQHMLIAQLPPPKTGDELTAYFDGYKAQKWTIHTNQNLIMVAEPNVQQELLQVFQDLR